MTNLNNEGFFEQLRQRRADRDRAATDRRTSNEQLRAMMLGFMDPIFDLLGAMQEAGVRFPAGAPPTREAAVAMAESCKSTPKVSISIDTRRQLTLECAVRESNLIYSAYIWEISSKSSLLETNNVADVQAWLMEQIAQFEYQPSRQTQPGTQRRTGMPPATPGPWVPPEDGPVIEDDDEGSDGREQRVIDLR